MESQAHKPDSATLHRRPPARPQSITALDPEDRSPPHVQVIPWHNPLIRRLKDRYAVIRNRMLSPFLKYGHPELAQLGFDQLLLNEGGMSYGLRRKFCARLTGQLSGKTILIAGCGWGTEVLTWLNHRPARVIAVDLFNYRRCWDDVTQLAAQAGVSVVFHQADLTAETWPFTPPESVDVVASDAVLEHVADLPAFLATAYRVLRKDGMFYATYGPLWFGPMGDHIFTNRSEDVFNHLLMDENEYEAHVTRIEQAQSLCGNAGEGPFLLRHGLFSYLKIDEYLRLFADARYEPVFTQAKVAMQLTGSFRRRFPEKYLEIKRRHNLQDADMYGMGCNVWLRKC